MDGVIRERFCKARYTYNCCILGNIIKPGEEYYCATIKDGAEIYSVRYSLEGLAVWTEAWRLTNSWRTEMSSCLAIELVEFEYGSISNFLDQDALNPNSRRFIGLVKLPGLV